MYDIIIKNGTVIDGTGRKGFLGDVGIKEDKIVRIGELKNDKGAIEINAKGKIVCPGFIDVNNHSDTYWRIFVNPDLESLISQGITTIIGGNCGSSLAPLYEPETIESIRKWIDVEKISVNWRNLKEFFKVLENKKLSVNFGTLIGHATLRRGVLKDEFRNLKPIEMEAVKRMLVRSMKDGALGMSTGLVYTHARTASMEELIELAKIVKKYNGVYATHIRGEKEELIEAVSEALEVAKNTGVKLQISHLKAMGQKNWPLMAKALKLIEKAKKSGLDVTFDVYPYPFTGSVLYTLLPDWISEGGRKIMLSRLRDPATRAKAIREMKKSSFNYSKVEIAVSSLNKTLARKKISEIAETQGKSVEEAIIDILIASGGRVIASMDVLSEENVKMAIKHPLSIISSNGAGYKIMHRETGELIHPRCFGTFSKVLSEFVREKRTITLESAINKMTFCPAEKFKIEKRGQIKKGNFADLVVFDKAKINSPATKENPYQYSRGIDFVLVNGKIAIQESEFTGNRNGKIIKR